METDNDGSQVSLKYPSPFPVFLIGTSGQGVRSLQFLAENLPHNFPSPFFFLLHRQRQSPVTEHLLLNVIAPISKLPVKIPDSGEEVVAGTIYLPSYGHHLTIQDSVIMHTTEPSDANWRPSIDVLFKSGAREYKKQTVSVLLTGDLDDGIEGLIETTHQGGITIAQSPDDAYNPVLPLNALLKDHPQYVLPLRDMPALFCELAGYGCYEDQEAIARKAAIAASRKKKEVKG